MKIMRHLVTIIIAFVLMSPSMFGQTTKQKRAERQFNSFSFVKAIKTYENLVEKNVNDAYALRKLGDAYIMLRQPEKALPIYEKVVMQENVPSEYYLYYAQTLRANGKYEASKKWMQKYKDAGNEKDLRVKSFFMNDDMASGIFNSYEKNILKEVDFNSKYNDFGAVSVNDHVIFASSRYEGAAIKRKYAWDSQPLLDIFKVSQEGGEVVRLKGKVNSKFHDGAATFNSDGTKMFFSRNNYDDHKKIKDEEGIMNVGIFTADLIDGKWENVSSTSLNNPNYIVYHPSLNKEENKLYFSSDMPGGIGGTDIYVVTINEDGSLGTPENLGPVVNTEGNEAFPFIHDEEDNLYFSSDGHPGFGLMDVFVSIKDENSQIVNVINLGKPMNSEKDDFKYFLSKEGFEGFISSNREGGSGGDDIYAFTRIPPLTLKGQITDSQSGEPVAGAKVVLVKKNGEEIGYIVTEEDGMYEHLIHRDENFVLKGSKDAYQNIAKTFDSYGMETETELVVDLNITRVPEMKDSVVAVKVLEDLDHIYFDFDKSMIRADAAVELDKVVALMKKYSEMVIQLESHTDSRGSNQYNLSLSNRRAKSTYKYIISKGIEKERIQKYEGFGETKLVNKCTSGVKCSESEHQANRRTEFIIVKMK